MEIAKLPNYDYCAVLGDDIDVGFNMPIWPELLLDAYDLLEFPIAWEKTRVSWGVASQTEFLRVISLDSFFGINNSRAGYPSRAISSLVYFKPWASWTAHFDYAGNWEDPGSVETFFTNMG